MKLTVKTLKGTHFDIRVHPSDTIMAVKKNIEELQGRESYPWGQQLLIHNGKVLKDESTLEENKVSEDGFLVVMLSKSKSSGAGGASSSQTSAVPAARKASEETSAPVPPTSDVTSRPERPVAEVPSGAYDQAASSVVSGNNIEQMVSQLLEMGGGSWDRDIVMQALRAAYNNPERAVEYLYAGIPLMAEFPVPVASQGFGQTAPAGETHISSQPNSSPLNLFPEGSPNPGVEGVGSLDFLRHNQQFQALRDIIQANPQILQPMLQELSKQNPDLLRLIQDNNAEFLQLLNEPDDTDGEFEDQADDMPHSVSIRPEDQEAIGRLEELGFDRARVIEAFLACDRNEQLAANYLIEHMGEE